MKNLLTLAALTAVIATAPVHAQDVEKPEMLSPGQIVDQAPAEEWQAIAASDLLIMKLQPDAKGKERQIIIQLMPPPFSQGWIRNIRKLAKANWWDDTRIVRVQDNYVVQWGDPAQEESDRKPLPDGLEVMTEGDYLFSEEDIDQVHEKLWNDDPDAALRAELSPDFSTGEALDIVGTRSKKFPEGWHERDSYSYWVQFHKGWPIGNEDKSSTAKDSLGKLELNKFWSIHCYGAVGVGRGLSPNTGDGSQLYTVIGHAPRHLDRNIAVVGRIIEGMHHLSSLPRGFGPLGFYETQEEQVPIQSIRLVSELPAAEQPRFEFLSTESKSFAKYANRRANREPPFFIKPAGGADICNIPVPVRRVKAAD